MDPTLGSNHFLSLPRPDIVIGPPAGTPDTTTLAAHDFDVDTRTGFMPPQPPLSRLPSLWEPWESALEDAIRQKLKLGDTPGIAKADMDLSESWRERVRDLPIIPITELKKSEVALRRAHHVLGWIMHFYIHSLPPDVPILIPPPITLPILQVAQQLQLPPVLTYSDDVLYNWELKTPSPSGVVALDNLRCQTLFTGTADEEEFYLTSSRIELKGVEALELMQATMDEAFVGDDIALRRITAYLGAMAAVIDALRAILLSVREGCDPDVFYHRIRPWFRGADSDARGRRWVFEGVERDPGLREPRELSGPSAGQSSLVHALDIFLGVDQYSHSSSLTGSSSSPSSSSPPSSNAAAAKAAFLDRMQLYMPRHHRTFLAHLSSNPRPLRELVAAAGDPALLGAYNAAVLAMKAFRDAHMIVVALYIVGPSRRPAPGGGEVVRRDFTKDYGEVGVGKGKGKGEGKGEGWGGGEGGSKPLKGTGGTELVRFLKDVRDRTAGAVLPTS